jgi:photosystem II stability/assembly factor-like uncharacterized protein
MICILVLFSSSVYGQSGWFWQNPMPTGNNYVDICIINDSVAIMVSLSGDILKTTDSGISWFFYNNGVENSGFVSINFINENTGFIAGGKIYKTTNGGDKWINLLTPGSCESFFGLNDNILFAGVSNNRLHRSTNGGSNWEIVDQGSGSYNDVYFKNSNTGFAACNVLKITTNGGSNWQTILDQTYGRFYSVYFLDSLFGVATSIYGVFKSTNGGLNWTLSYSTSFLEYHNSAFFASPLTGYVTARSGVNLRTTNQGNTWEVFHLGNWIRKVGFFNISTGLIIGDGGQIFRTTNAGFNWNFISSNITSFSDNLIDICFPEGSIGYIVGYNGTFLKTINKGDSWFRVNVPMTSDFTSTFFLNNNTGFISEYYGKIFRTFDGGVSWDSNNINTAGNGTLFFINNSTGFLATSSLFKTTDGGNNWSISRPGTHGPISFVNDTLGYTVGIFTGAPFNPPYSRLYKTTNSGEDWSFVSEIDTNVFIRSMKVINGDIIYFSDLNQHVFKTTNGGNSIGRVFNKGSQAMDFFDENNGYIPKYRTFNGGLNWVLDNFPTDDITKVKFLNRDTIISIGYYGRILRTNDTGGIISSINIIGSEILPSSFSLHQNYPNPFNPSTRIKFEIPKGAPVKLRVYDMLGREVAELVNEKLNAGVYEYEWNGVGLPSGVYFYKLEAENFVETKRMVLVK